MATWPEWNRLPRAVASRCMELGDGNFPPPFTPPPPEPFKFLFVCEPNDERVKQLVRQDWERWVTGSVFIEDPEKWNDCKGLVFFSGPTASGVSYDTAHLMRKFLARDGREAFVYQLDSITRRFVSRDEDWLNFPGRCYLLSLELDRNSA